MESKLNSYTVDIQHRVIILRPVAGPEVRVDERALVAKLTPEAERHIDRHSDVKRLVTGEIENRLRELRRALPALQAQSPEWWSAKREIESLEKANTAKLCEMRRNQLVAETAKSMAQEQMSDLLQALGAGIDVVVKQVQ